MVLEESLIRYRSEGRVSPISAVSGVRLSAMSRGQAWTGVHIEVGVSNSWNGEDTMVDGHMVTLNTSDEPINLERRAEDSSRWAPVTRMPNALMINPEGRPFSYRHWKGVHSWIVVIVDGRFLDSVMGGHYELRGGENIIDDQLGDRIRRMVQKVVSGDAQDVSEIRSLICDFTISLANGYGIPASNNGSKGGLAPAQLKLLLDWIQANIDNRITVGKMATLVGLSEAHFAREFKRSTNKTPWEYVVDYRLTLAGKMLTEGESAAVTAIRCGFFDQAHLSRQFKQHYGVSPSAFVRERQRGFFTLK